MSDFTKDSEIEFYVVKKGTETRFMATVGHQGGFVYYAFDEVKDGKYSKIVVNQVDDIVEICGAPDVQVYAVTAENPRTFELYVSLCETFNKFLKQKLSEIKSDGDNKDDEESLKIN